jgi:hypothetical protein
MEAKITETMKWQPSNILIPTPTINSPRAVASISTHCEFNLRSFQHVSLPTLMFHRANSAHSIHRLDTSQSEQPTLHSLKVISKLSDEGERQQLRPHLVHCGWFFTLK